jgi:hypothetical protein
VPLTVDSVVQENTGTVTTPGTSCVVSLPAGTAAGNTVLVFLSSGQDSTAPSGFVLDKTVGIYLRAYRKSEVTAGETSWTFTTLSNSLFSWYAVELSGVDAVEPLDVSASNSSGLSNGGTLSTGTTPLDAALNVVVFGVFRAAQVGGSVESWSGYTNSFEEVADVGGSGAGQLGVARKFIDSTTSTFESTATLATTQSPATCNALVVAYRAADSPIIAPLAMFAGMEWGTHGGINSHTGITSMMGATLAHAGTWGTTYLIQASSARNSSYGLRIVQSGAGARIPIGDLNIQSGSFGFNVRVISAVGTVIVAAVINQIGSVFAQVLYDATNSKFGVRVGTTGTVSWESGTTGTNVWRWVDLRVRTNVSTWRVEWRIETGTGTYTDQAAAELTGQSGASFYSLQFGYNAAQTMTADFDDAILSKYWVAYPLGPHQVKLLTVDPTGTPTLSGTSTNFSVFTANGTLGAWNAANARTAVDEVPPDVSATADGVCQTAVAASDYIEFPMATYTAGPTETIVGVRMLAPAWGGTGTGTGTLGLRGWDGATEALLVDAVTSYDAGSPTAISSTEPRWQCAMWQSPNGWTQAELDAAAVRVGFSTDATPDMGVHAVYLEVAVGPTRSQPMIGTVGELSTTAEVNPNNAGIVSVTMNTPADLGATLRWTDPGGSGSQAVAAAGSYTKQFDPADSSTVSLIGVDPDPDPDQPG